MDFAFDFLFMLEEFLELWFWIHDLWIRGYKRIYIYLSHPGKEFCHLVTNSEVAGEDEGGACEQSKPKQISSRLLPLHPLRQVDQGHLSDDEPQEYWPDDPANDGEQELVDEGTEHEGDDLGSDFAVFPPDEQLQVEMAVQKQMDGLVPFPVELLIGGWVPPVLIVLPVVEPGDFGEDVGDVLECHVEEHQQQHGCWQHFHQQQFEETQLAAHFNRRHDVLGANDVCWEHEHQTQETLLHDVHEWACFLPGVDIIHYPRCPHEEHEVLHIYVLGVGCSPISIAFLGL